MYPGEWRFHIHICKAGNIYMSHFPSPYLQTPCPHISKRKKTQTRPELVSCLKHLKMPGGFHPPPSVIASWPKPNYVDPVTKGKGLFAVSLVLCIIAIILVGARIYIRSRIQRQLGWDDYFLALGLVCGILLWISIYLPLRNAFNKILTCYSDII